MSVLIQGCRKGIKHCYRGDVFQIVLSRRFSQIERVELKDDPNALLEFEDKLVDQDKDKDNDNDKV